MPGYDVCGYVAAVGSSVTGLKPGDEVFGLCLWPAAGACAEYARAAPDKLALKPAGLTFEEQRSPVVAQRIRHVPVRRLRPHAHRPHPWRRVLRHVLVHEGFLAPMDADDRQRPVLEHWQDPIPDAVEVRQRNALA